jgi:hypothetical protein
MTEIWKEMNMGNPLIELVQSYAQACNERDIEAAMAMCTDDIRFEMVGAGTKVGKDDVRLFHEFLAELNVSLSMQDLAVSGDTVSHRTMERNDVLRLVGIGEITYANCHVSFRDGLIAGIQAELAPSSREAFDAAMRPVMAWASRERKEVLAQLMPQGEFVHTAQNARIWLALLQDWRQSLRGSTI